MFRKILILFLLLLTWQIAMVAAGHSAWCVSVAHADSGKDGGEDYGGDGDHNSSDDKKLDDVRDAVKSKKLLPLQVLKGGIVTRFGPQIIEIDIEKNKGKWVYEFKVIDRRGRLIQVYVDANTGSILEVKNE